MTPSLTEDLIVGILANIERKVDILMSDAEQLSTDESALEAAFAQLTADLTAALTDLHVQVVALQGNSSDADTLTAIDRRLEALIVQVQAADASVKSADPGAPADVAPPADPAPVETTVPDPLTTTTPPPAETTVPDRSETPETPAPPEAAPDVPPASPDDIALEVSPDPAVGDAGIPETPAS